MVFLSQLLGKKIYLEGRNFGTIEDLAVFQNRPHPPVSKIEIKTKGKKVTISPHSLSFENNKFILKNNHKDPFLPYDHSDFYLSEDLLDKQVIDTTGKRLVRVNDVALEVNGELKVAGIDIGFAGILRRLGFGNLSEKSKIVPWDEVEAFDYQTGAIKIKSVASNLNAFHPSELAEILEDVGAKERIGLVQALDSKNAARAIEETDEETQLSILETLPVKGSFKDILNKIKISELADIFSHLNTTKRKDVQNALTEEKAAEVKSLSIFSSQTAGGLMHPNFVEMEETQTVSDAMKAISDFEEGIPEIIVLVDKNKKFRGMIKAKNFLAEAPDTILSSLVNMKISVSTNIGFQDILELFSRYNLRGLTVVSSNKIPLGVILIDDVLAEIAKQKEENEIL